MAYTVYSGMVAYAKEALIQFAQNCKVAIFNDPNNQILTTKGKETEIREIRTTGAADYLGAWGDGTGTAENNGVKYYAPYDRKFEASVDRLAEVQSYLDGATPTLVGVARAFNKSQLAPEIDTVVLARFAGQAGQSHSTSDSGYAVGKSNILETLANIERDVANAGFDGDIVLFMSATVAADFQQACVAANILTNDSTIEREMTREAVDADNKLKVNIKVKRYNNFIIVTVPDNRMVGKVYLLNGVDPGQKDGGVLPAKNLSSYFDIKLLAVPMEAAYVNIKHIISQLFVPMGVDTAEYQADIALANEKLYGSLEIQNAGINQRADGFSFHERCVYGGDIFQIFRDSAVLVKGATEAQAVEPKSMEVDPTATLSGASAATSDVKIFFEDINCSGTVYFKSDATGKATVDASETLTVPAAGSKDMRPYCAPTVTFKATAGTATISAWADAAMTSKFIGKFTVTSTGA